MLSKAADIANKGEFQQYEYVELDRLKGNIGNQNYVIPADLDVSQYGSVVIYCSHSKCCFPWPPLRPRLRDRPEAAGPKVPLEGV